MLGFRDIFSLWPVVLAAMVLGLAIRLLSQTGWPALFLNQ